MTIGQNADLPVLWVHAIQRYSPQAAPSFLADARRYLVGTGPDRVPAGREVDTLRNLIAAYVRPADREAVLYELAVSSLPLAPAEPAQPEAPGVAGLLAVGSMVATGLVLARRRR